MIIQQVPVTWWMQSSCGNVPRQKCYDVRGEYVFELGAMKAWVFLRPRTAR